MHIVCHGIAPTVQDTIFGAPHSSAGSWLECIAEEFQFWRFGFLPVLGFVLYNANTTSTVHDDQRCSPPLHILLLLLLLVSFAYITCGLRFRLRKSPRLQMTTTTVWRPAARRLPCSFMFISTYYPGASHGDSYQRSWTSCSRDSLSYFVYIIPICTALCWTYCSLKSTSKLAVLFYLVALASYPYVYFGTQPK